MPSKPSHGPRRRLIEDARLFASVIRSDALLAAWARVWRNAGAAGGDNVTVDHFQLNVMRRIAHLRQSLLKGDYTPGPLRRAEIPKDDGGRRPLDIPCIADRVVQTAVADALSPLLDQEFEDTSFAYRKGRSVQQAVRRVSALRSAGHAYVVDADIKRFFECVPHDALMARLGEAMTEGPITELISLWLEHWFPRGRGLAQGSPISPLLANLYLDRLDETFAARDAAIVRYGDDFVILCRSPKGAEAALEKARRMLRDAGLDLNDKKTRVTDFERGFRFLGHLFVHSLVTPAQYEEGAAEVERLMQLLGRRDNEEAERAEAEESERERVRQAGLEPAQRILYILTPGRRLGIRNHAFAVEERIGRLEEDAAWRELLAVPHDDVDRIEIGPHAKASEKALDWALATDTAIAFVNGHGETMGWLSAGVGPRAGRQLAQARHALDPALRLELSCRFVDGRVRNQRALLRRLNRERKHKSVVKALSQLNFIIRRVPKATSLEQLRGYEGQATALYWPALGMCMLEQFGFHKRLRPSASDPVNIMLNMMASLLARDITVALVRAGLHPGYGFLHATSDRRDAGVYDLMEEFRAPLAEGPVVSVINRRSVKHDMFEHRESGGYRMGLDAKRAVIRAYEHAANRVVKSARTGRRASWRGIMAEQAQLLAAHFEEREHYAPYVVDY